MPEEVKQESPDAVIELCGRVKELALQVQLRDMKKDERVVLLWRILVSSIKQFDDVPTAQFVDIYVTALKDLHLNAAADIIADKCLELYQIINTYVPRRMWETKGRFFLAMSQALVTCSDTTAEKLIRSFVELKFSSAGQVEDGDVCLRMLKMCDTRIPIVRIQKLLLILSEIKGCPIYPSPVFRQLWKAWVLVIGEKHALDTLRALPCQAFAAPGAFDVIRKTAEQVAALVDGLSPEMLRGDSNRPKIDGHPIHCLVISSEVVQFYVEFNRREEIDAGTIRTELNRFCYEWVKSNPKFVAESRGVYIGTEFGSYDLLDSRRSAWSDRFETE